jgi:hypothetical protein
VGETYLSILCRLQGVYTTEIDSNRRLLKIRNILLIKQIIEIMMRTIVVRGVNCINSFSELKISISLEFS